MQKGRRGLREGYADISAAAFAPPLQRMTGLLNAPPSGGLKLADAETMVGELKRLHGEMRPIDADQRLCGSVCILMGGGAESFRNC